MEIKELVDKLLLLITDNPNLPVVTMTAYEVIQSDEHSYWMGEIFKVEKAKYWEYEETMWFDENKLDTTICDNIFDGTEGQEKMSDAEWQMEIDKAKKDIPCTEAIIIWIDV